MCKSEEGKNSTDGLIISMQTGRKDRYICKNTVCLELNSVKFLLLFTLTSSVVSQVKVHFFAETSEKNTFIPCLVYDGHERRQSGGEQSCRNCRSIQSIIDRAA